MWYWPPSPSVQMEALRTNCFDANTSCVHLRDLNIHSHPQLSQWLPLGNPQPSMSMLSDTMISQCPLSQCQHHPQPSLCQCLCQVSPLPPVVSTPMPSISQSSATIREIFTVWHSNIKFYQIHPHWQLTSFWLSNRSMYILSGSVDMVCNLIAFWLLSIITITVISMAFHPRKNSTW